MASLVKVSISGNWKAYFMRKSAFNAIIDKVFLAVGEWWHSGPRKKHFTHEGAEQYHYEPRTKGYLWAKRKAVGHTLPLVYSGMSRMLSGIKDIRQRRAGVRVVIHASTLNFLPRFKKGPKAGQVAKQIPMRDEMTAVSAFEVRNVMKILREKVQRAMDADDVRFHEDLN